MDSRPELRSAICSEKMLWHPAQVTTILRIARMQLARNAKVYVYFKVNAVLALVQSVAQLLIFLFMGRLAGEGQVSPAIGGNYASFLIIGMVLLQCLDKSLIAPYVSLSGAYWSARLEPLLLSPYSLWLFIITDTLWYYLLTTLNAVTILAVGYAFGATFDAPAHWSSAALVFLLGGISVFGLGLMSASTFSLINAKGHDEPISWAVHLLQGLVSGLYFPFHMLPQSLQYAGLMLPHTYAIDSVRRLFISGYTDGPTLRVHTLFNGHPLTINLCFLVICTAVYLPLGVYLFKKGLQKSHEVGSLSRWT